MPGDGTTASPRRRLKDRVPVRLRHHWKPAGALCAGLAVMVYAFGDVRISPYVTSASRVEADTITENVKGTVGLYDSSVAHSIQLEYNQTDFDKMMKEFREDGSKEYIEADLTIDGVFLKDVGIRLKGNSTLMSLRGTGQGMPGGGQAPPAGVGDGQGAPAPQQSGGTGGQANTGVPGANAQSDAGSSGTGDKADGGSSGTTGQDGMNPAGGGAGGMMQYDLSEKKPEELPWLIKVDEFIEGRAYQGEREISLRPGSNDQVPVNEALSLNLMDETGLKNERYAFTSVKVNQRPVATRLMVENPDTEYAESVGDGNGVLYKARAGSSFAYQGDDPTDYEDSFKQLNKVGSQDLKPVMKLIKWLDQASDKEFAEELDQYVDVESLATYVATQNLLMNFDDMAGPGKNYLLWYDLDTKKFTVLGWDYNLTFSGDATAGPDDDMSMGGGPMPGGQGGTTTGQDAQQGQNDQNDQDLPSGMPTGMPTDMPQGMPTGMPQGMPTDMPQGMPSGMPGAGAGAGQDSQGQQGGAQGPGGGDMPEGMGISTGHPLKERFQDSSAFDKIYKKAYSEQYQKFYGSGTALKALDRVADQAEAVGKGLDTVVENLRKTVKERTEALAKNKEVTG
ncbi:CotH kinase family protein [Streptomyces sp. NPDC052052]|uniref:CotH kinase family protein n=1 Tax=Streptomyces sp. NPDC052052 TaxID=3154756 RepID=UPI00342859BD